MILSQSFPSCVSVSKQYKLVVVKWLYGWEGIRRPTDSNVGISLLAVWPVWTQYARLTSMGLLFPLLLLLLLLMMMMNDM